MVVVGHQMFEEIVDILDPEMNMVEEDEIPEEQEEDVAQEQQQAASAMEHAPTSARSVADSYKSE